MAGLSVYSTWVSEIERRRLECARLCFLGNYAVLIMLKVLGLLGVGVGSLRVVVDEVLSLEMV